MRAVPIIAASLDRDDMHGRRRCLTQLSALAASLGLPAWLTSCGALIHPERVGQPRTGRLDPGVVLLDGLGLLLFLVPGLIAFIVDFSTGAIYLPPEHYGLDDAKPTTHGLVKISVDRDQLSRKRVEQLVSEASGKSIRLEPGRYSAAPIESVDDYQQSLAMLEERASGPRADVVFRCQSE